MPFDREDIKVATLYPAESHLHSFVGCLGEWIMVRSLFGKKRGECPIYIEGARFPGHITDRRLILEFPNSSALGAILGKFAPKAIGAVFGTATGKLLNIGAEGRAITYQLAKDAGYLSFDFKDMAHLGYMEQGSNMFWPVMKNNLGGREPLFMAYYTTDHRWMPCPEPEAFLEMIRGLGLTFPLCCFDQIAGWFPKRTT